MLRLRTLQWCTVRFSTSARAVLVERKLYTDLCAKYLCPICEAAEGDDFPKLDPDPVGLEPAAYCS